VARLWSGGFEESPTPHSNAARRVGSEFALWSHRKFANNRKARARPLARQTPEACHCHAPTPSVQMANGRSRAVIRPWRHPYDVLGVDFGTPGCAPALGPELLRDRNSYKNNTARTPAFQTWAVQWKSSPGFKESSLIPAEPGRAACPKRCSSNANGLCGQKSARSAEILRDFQRDILSRHI
jgi:hypothetical protein